LAAAGAFGAAAGAFLASAGFLSSFFGLSPPFPFFAAFAAASLSSSMSLAYQSLTFFSLYGMNFTPPMYGWRHSGMLRPSGVW